MSNMYGRQVVFALVNKSGGGVIAGDVVIIDTTNDGAFTTTTTGAYSGSLGVAQETIANNATGRVLVSGYAALVNVNASVTRGHFLKTHTVVKQGTGSSSRVAGVFGQFTTGGTTPTAWLWGFPDNAGASGETVATSAIWTAKGQIAAATGSGAAAALTVGANDTILMADSSQSTGLKYVGSQTPSTQTPGDAAAEGTADTYARGDHKHALTITTVVGDCTADVTLTADTEADATGCSISLTAGTWDVWGMMTFDTAGGATYYILMYISDSSNVHSAIARGTVTSGSPVTLNCNARVSPGSTTTYKLRGQSGLTNNHIKRYGTASVLGTRIFAHKVA